jgi:hypothetical protein
MLQRQHRSQSAAHFDAERARRGSPITVRSEERSADDSWFARAPLCLRDGIRGNRRESPVLQGWFGMY